MDPTAPGALPGVERPATRTLARVDGRAGELVLRACAGEYEIISNGMFLMDTRDGRSERLLVRSALEAVATTSPAARPRVLIGGLGVGWSLAAALAAPDVADILVVEWEPAVVAWNCTYTGARTGGRISDPRVRCELVDLVAWLRQPTTERFDAICLDVDNGPEWTLSAENAWLYGREGLAVLRDRLTPDGVLTIWSAHASPAFQQLLEGEFTAVARRDVAVPRGAPDVVYVAQP